MTEFAEPAFAYTHTAFKGNPRWQCVIVLGKTESQDTYIVYTGSTIMLTRSVRRIATDWKCHMVSFSTSTPLHGVLRLDLGAG